MNRREKILAGSVGGILALLLLVYGVRVVFLTPLRDLDKRIALARERIVKVQAERRNYFTAEDRLKAITRTAFADTADYLYDCIAKGHLARFGLHTGT